MSNTIQISNLRARGLPRSRLLFSPSTCVEVHTKPGGAPTARSPSVESSTAPSWSNFTYEHVVTPNCGAPVKLALVVRDTSTSSGIVLGRTHFNLSSAFTSGWFPLIPDEPQAHEYTSTDGHELKNDSNVESASESGSLHGSTLLPSTTTTTTTEIHCTIFWPSTCVFRPRKCGQHVDTNALTAFHVPKSHKHELREVASEPGEIFRNGELIVSVIADAIHASTKNPHVKISTQDQLLFGDETEQSREEWKQILRKEAEISNANVQLVSEPVDSILVEQTQASEFPIPDVSGEIDEIALEDEMEVDANDNSEKLRPRSRSHDLARKVLNTSGKIAVKGAVASGRAGAKVIAARQLHPTSSAPGRISQVGSALHGFLSTSPRTSMSSVSDERVPSQQSSSQNISTVDIPVTETSSKNEATIKEQLEVIGASDEAFNANTSTKEKDPSTLSISLETPEIETVAENADIVTKEHTVAYPSVLSRRRRRVVFGGFRFAVIEGAPPTNVMVHVTDRMLPLPPPLTSLATATVQLPNFSEFRCNCDKSCNSWTMNFRYNDVSVGAAKGSLTISIQFKASKSSLQYNNVTPRFWEIFPNITTIAQTFKEEYPKSEQLTYLFIGGLFTQHYPNYFTKNIKFLQEDLCLPRVQTVPIHTEGNVERNAKVIRDSILKTCRGANSIVLLGHSKGGVDAIAVIEKYPETRPFIKGIVTFQAPFGGTFLVDFVSRSHLAVSAITSVIKNLWRGDKDCLGDMGYSARREAHEPWLMDREREDIKGNPTEERIQEGICRFCRSDIGKNRTDTGSRCLHCVPIISFASYASFDPLGIRNAAGAAGIASMAPAAQKILHHTGFQCDGLVARCDALVPGSDAVLLDDMMHTEPALFFPGTKYDPGHLTGTAIVLLLEKADKNEYNVSSAQGETT